MPRATSDFRWRWTASGTGWRETEGSIATSSPDSASPQRPWVVAVKCREDEAIRIGAKAPRSPSGHLLGSCTFTLQARFPYATVWIVTDRPANKAGRRSGPRRQRADDRQYYRSKDKPAKKTIWGASSPVRFGPRCGTRPGGRQVYKVGMDQTDYPPFATKDTSGSGTGWEVDLAMAVCETAKIKCELFPTAWDGIIPALQEQDRFHLRVHDDQR